MHPTYEAVFSLMKAALWGAPYAPPADSGALLRELEEQGVRDLAADVLADRPAIQSAANRMTHFYAVMGEQAAVLQLLSGIPVVVLKGAAAARYYPRPEYRKLGDVDLLIPPAQFNRACAILEQAGYVRYLDKPRHAGYRRTLTRFELHRFFTEKGGSPLDELLLSAPAGQAEVCGYAFPVLPPALTGLVFLEHTAQHLRGSFGLRQVLDWMLYAHAVLTDEFYEKEFAPLARRCGYETLAVTMTRLCQLYLGLPETITWCRNADEEACRELLELILEGGNFGEKDIDSAKAVSVLNMAKHPIRFLGQLQSMGCETWTALRKYPWLKCFAWLYQLCRFIRRGFARKNALSSLHSDGKKADRLRQLLHRLELE